MSGSRDVGARVPDDLGIGIDVSDRDVSERCTCNRAIKGAHVRRVRDQGIEAVRGVIVPVIKLASLIEANRRKRIYMHHRLSPFPHLVTSFDSLCSSYIKQTLRATNSFSLYVLFVCEVQQYTAMQHKICAAAVNSPQGKLPAHE
jgi:hypothetical protein